MIKVKTKQNEGSDTEKGRRGMLWNSDTHFTHSDLPRKPDGFRLKLWKELGGRTMSAEDWESVVLAYKTGRQPPIFKGFKTAKGEEYAAPVEIWMTAGGIRADIAPRNEGTALDIRCPVTNEPLLMRRSMKNSPYYLAKGFPGLVMHGNVRNRTITPQEWLEVLKAGLEGKPGPQMTFKNQQGAPYNMALQIVQNEQGKFEVENQYEIEKTATKVICPVSKTPIMESKNSYFSDAFPEMRFPKHFWGHAFTPEEVCLVVEATANKTDPPRFTFTRGGGRGTYEAAISLGKDGFLVPTPIESETAAQGITV
jgi:hypothetical protein